MEIIQPSLRDLGNPKSLSPTLKRWAILVCPSGTRVCPGLARILWDQILAALDIPHPGGMTENSPTFQRWVREFRGAQVPKGRLKPGAIHQPSLRDLSGYGRWFPTLKRWAIIGCPSGTKACPGLPRILWDQILAALDLPVRLARWTTPKHTPKHIGA